MRRSKIAALVAATVVTAVVGWVQAAGAAGPPAPFVGVWEAIDADGSNLLTAFSGGSVVRWTQFDDYATACGGSTVVWRGSGTLEGNVLTGAFDDLRCHGGLTWTGPFPSVFVYDPGTDTIVWILDLGGNYIYVTLTRLAP